MSITIRTPTTNMAANDTQSTLDLTMPTGMVENDVDHIAGCYSASGTSLGYATPSGFTKQFGALNAVDTLENLIADRLAPATPGTVTVTHGQTRKVMGCRIGLGGVDLAQPVNVKSSAQASGTFVADPGGNAVIPALTTTVAGCVAIAALAFANGGGSGMTQWTFPSGWTQIHFDKTGSGNGQIAHVVGYKLITDAGTTGAFDCAFLRAGNFLNIYWQGAMIAYQPVQSAPGPTIRARPRRILW